MGDDALHKKVFPDFTPKLVEIMTGIGFRFSSKYIVPAFEFYDSHFRQCFSEFCGNRSCVWLPIGEQGDFLEIRVELAFGDASGYRGDMLDGCLVADKGEQVELGEIYFQESEDGCEFLIRE